MSWSFNFSGVISWSFVRVFFLSGRISLRKNQIEHCTHQNFDKFKFTRIQLDVVGDKNTWLAESSWNILIFQLIQKKKLLEFSMMLKKACELSKITLFKLNQLSSSLSMTHFPWVSVLLTSKHRVLLHQFLRKYIESHVKMEYVYILLFAIVIVGYFVC